MPDFTKVRKIVIGATTDLDAEISTLCNNMAASRFALASSFLHGNTLVMIFQRTLP